MLITRRESMHLMWRPSAKRVRPAWPSKSPMDSGGALSARTTALSLFCVLAIAGGSILVAPTTAQGPGPIDLSLEAVSVFVAGAVNQPVSGPIVIGEDNTITAVVKNHGKTQVDAAVVATASDADGSWGPVSVSVKVPAGTTKSVTFPAFDGTYDEDDKEFTGTVTINVEVYVSPEEMVAELFEELGISESDLDPFSDAWSGLWDDNIASLQELVEDTLFSDETEPAEGAWNALWGSHVPSLRVIIESIVLQERPTRLDSYPADNQQELTRQVAWHAISLNPVTTIPSGYQLNVENGEEWQSLIWVTNEGTRDDVVDIHLEDASLDWDFQLDYTFLLLPTNDSEKAVIVTMKGKPTVAAGDQGQVKLVVTSRNAPLTATNSATLVSPPAQVNGKLAIAILEPLSVSIAAGSSTSFKATVKNLQNQDLTITLLPVEPTNDGWSGTLPGSQTATGIGPGVTAEFTVNIGVGSAVIHGTYDFNVAVTTHVDSTLRAAPVSFTVDVLQWHGVDFTLTKDLQGNSLPKQVEPGSLTPISFNVENKGNGVDSFQISLIDAPLGWQLVDANGVPPAAFVLDPFDTEIIGSHFLKTPATTLPGTKSIRLRITSELSGATTDVITHDLAVPARVFPGITITGNACQGEAFVCAMAEDSELVVPLTITNHGNVAGDLDLTALKVGSQGWTALLTPESFTLASGASAQATLTITSPATIAIDDAATIALKLLAKTQHQGNVTNKDLVAVGAFADLAIGGVSNDPSPLYLNVPGEFTFEVKNEGVADAGAFDAKVVYSAGGATVSTKTAAIPSLAKGATTSITVDVPTLAGYKNLKATITLDLDDEIPEYAVHANTVEVDLTLRTFDIQVTAPSDMIVDSGQAISLEGTLGFLVENAGSSAESLVITLEADQPWTAKAWPVEALAPAASKRYGTNFFIPDWPESMFAEVTLRVRHAVHGTLEAEASFTIRVNDAEPPQIQSYPLDVDEVPRARSVNFTARIWDPSGIDAAKVILLLPTGVEQRIAMTYDDVTERHFAVVQLTSPGPTEWYIWARDASPDKHENNTAAAPHSVRVLSESQPRLNLVSPAPGQSIRPGQQVIIALADTTGIQSAEAVVLGETIILPNTHPIMLATDAWPDGAVAVTVSIVDLFGSSAHETYTIQVDGTPPSIGAAFFDATAAGEASNVVVRVTDNDRVAKVMLRVDPGAGGAARDEVMSADGASFSVQVLYPSKGGSLTVIATDAAGNTASKLILGEGGIDSVAGQDAPGFSGVWILLLVAGLAAGRIRERRR